MSLNGPTLVNLTQNNVINIQVSVYVCIFLLLHYCMVLNLEWYSSSILLRDDSGVS